MSKLPSREAGLKLQRFPNNLDPNSCFVWTKIWMYFQSMLLQSPFRCNYLTNTLLMLTCIGEQQWGMPLTKWHAPIGCSIWVDQMACSHWSLNIKRVTVAWPVSWSMSDYRLNIINSWFLQYMVYDYEEWHDEYHNTSPNPGIKPGFLSIIVKTKSW